MYKGCIFDLDGTLIDSLEDLAYATNDALRRLNEPTHPIEAYKMFVGSGVRNLIKRAMPQAKDKQDLALEYFYDYYSEHCLDHTYIYDGMKDVVETLIDRGYRIAVVTNKPDILARMIVHTLFEGKIQIVYGQVDAIPVKPDPTLVYKAIQVLNLDPNYTYYIGDSDVDIYTAQNAHLKSIGCLWGNRSQAELIDAGADQIASKPLDLLELL